jgi:hypothetical protein
MRWNLPFFYISRARNEVDAKEAQVKIWRNDVLIFDDAVDIRWEEYINDYSYDPPCGCWHATVRPWIMSFDGPPG